MSLQLESKELRTQQSQALRAKAPIRAHFEDCVQAFDRLCSAINANMTASEEEIILVEDCYSRLRSWGQDSGASTRALDHGLRKSSELGAHTLNLLSDLHSILHEGEPSYKALHTLRNIRLTGLQQSKRRHRMLESHSKRC